METIKNFFGKTTYWWGILLLGILITLVGIWMMFYPIQGYIFIARVFGWALLISGVFEIVISTTLEKKLPGWGWWLAGGIIDIIIGVILIANIALTEMVLPYFFAFIFLFKGIQNIIASFIIISSHKYWWLYLINGVLMLIISWMFFSSANTPAFITDFLVSVFFIYWGVMLTVFSFDLKPMKRKDE
ncbi:MAG: DUF308 domain-containing protein [Bacteroidales bacterium]